MSWPLQYGYYYQQTPYFPCTPRVMTPVIPDPTIYPHSPYFDLVSPNRPTDPTTPNTPTLELPPNSPWESCRRKRRLSWQGFNTDYFWPYSNAAAWPRRNSVGYCWPGVMSTINQFAPFLVNPWIDADSPRFDFFFDLSLTTFEPMQLYGAGQSRRFPGEQIMQLATYPPLTRLKVVFDQSPEWPCYIQRFPSQPQYPIMLYDVLKCIHIHMHIPITMSDFADLEPWGRARIAEAFTERCRAIPNNFTEERASGVKRVDYLLGETRFIGLLHQGREDGWDTMKVVVTRIRT